MILLFIINLLSALNFSLSKYALAYIDPVLFFIVRTVTGGALCALYYYYMSTEKAIMTKYLVGMLVMIGALNVYAANLLQLQSLTTIPSSRACLLFNTAPFIVVVLNYFLLGTKISYMKIMGLVCGWIGLLITVGGDFAVSQTICAGDWFILAAALATSISALIMERALTTHPISTAYFNAFIFLCGGSFAVMYPGLSLSTCISIKSMSFYILLVIALVMGTTITTALLYTHLLRKYSAAFVLFTGFTAPLFAALFDWSFFGHTVAYTFPISLLCIAIGLYLFYKADS
ncbi:MAG: DMT family transporter [Candidatus Babeliaceae bacterium]|jgi:drug/metabolite transporter (DMT)-like permease